MVDTLGPIDALCANGWEAERIRRRRGELKRIHAPVAPVGDDYARMSVMGIAGYLLAREVSGRVALLLCRAFNEACVFDPLDVAEVDRLVNAAAKHERGRRLAA